MFFVKGVAKAKFKRHKMAKKVMQCSMKLIMNFPLLCLEHLTLTDLQSSGFFSSAAWLNLMDRVGFLMSLPGKLSILLFSANFGSN